MYVAVQSQASCARAWVAASNSIMATGDEGYNVVIDVANPITHDEIDCQVIKCVDDFLRLHQENPIATVSNTIFPQALYEAYGAPAFYSKYCEGFDGLKDTKGWGRYFERMTRHVTLEGVRYNPLQELIEKLGKNREGGRQYKSAYELAVYDPLRDRRYLRGGQCLSFLSFKCHPTKGLMLTAMYRNHTYVTRCLGNLIGLGRLQAFVAKEAGLAVGHLTCISTHAEIDKCPWGASAARSLIHRSNKIIEISLSACASVKG